MKFFAAPVLFLVNAYALLYVHTANAQANTSKTHLDQAMNSVEQMLEALPAVCQNKNSLLQKTISFQNKLVSIKQTVRQIKENYVIRDPSLFSYIHTLDFYLNQSRDFNYDRKIPKSTKKLKEYISGLSFSFQTMYRVAFNVPEDTPADKFPAGWGQSIGAALTCLQNHQ